MGTGRPPGRPRKVVKDKPVTMAEAVQESRADTQARRKAEKAALLLWEQDKDPFKGPAPKLNRTMIHKLTDDEKWIYIRAGYRAGLQPAILERLYGIKANTIQVRAKRSRERNDGLWERDLLAQAEVVTEDEMARAIAEGRKNNVIPEQIASLEAQAMAAARITVIHRHRRDIGKLLETAGVLMDRLDQFIRTGDTDLPFKGEKESPADVLKKTADALRHLVPLERSVLGIESGEKKADPNEGKYGIAWMPPKKTMEEALEGEDDE